jgi:hypothetical protein
MKIKKRKPKCFLLGDQSGNNPYEKFDKKMNMKVPGWMRISFLKSV